MRRVELSSTLPSSGQNNRGRPSRMRSNLINKSAVRVDRGVVCHCTRRFLASSSSSPLLYRLIAVLKLFKLLVIQLKGALFDQFVITWLRCRVFIVAAMMMETRRILATTQVNDDSQLALLHIMKLLNMEEGSECLGLTEVCLQLLDESSPASSRPCSMDPDHSQ